MKNKEFTLPVIISVILTVIISAVAFFFDTVCGVLCLILGTILCTVFIILTKRRYKRIGELNNYLSQVLGGNYELRLSDNAEGELSILENNLLKVISNLKSSNETIKKDKTYLADSLADISHQLKTPLTSIMMITDLLKEEAETQKQQEFVGIIENQCDKMRWLTANLLKISKLDAGTIDFNFTRFSAGELIFAALKPFELTLELKNISIHKSLTDFEINGDKNWLCEAVQNIIKNCIEHTDAGGELVFSSGVTTIYNEITIRDNGCGIAEEDLEHIFERFYHGKNSSRDSVGIGLALSGDIFKKHNASVIAQSEEGKGTEFIIRFYKSIV